MCGFCKSCNCAKSKAWNKANLAKKSETSRIYRAENHELLLIKKREYREKNREAIKKQRSDNRSVYKIAQAKWRKAKYLSSPWFRASVSLRSRIQHAVKSKNSKKCTASAKLVGCGIDELKAHLESKFEFGMGWHNYGRAGWHIDHIKPCNAFDLTDPAQQMACFHFLNLQPLWWDDNRAKSDRINDSD